MSVPHNQPTAGERLIQSARARFGFHHLRRSEPLAPVINTASQMTIPKVGKAAQLPKWNLISTDPALLMERRDLDQNFRVEIRATHCCGVKEIQCIQSVGPSRPPEYLSASRDYWRPEDVLGFVHQWMERHGYYVPGVFWFVEATEYNWHDGAAEAGRALQKFIEDNDLGTIHRVPFYNPNSGNQCIHFTWVVNLHKSAVSKWTTARPSQRRPEDGWRDEPGRF